MVAYGVRSVAGIAFSMTFNPKSYNLIGTLVALMTAADLEEVVIDSLYSKRIPGDVRATMKSAQTFFGKLGHLAFVVFSLAFIDYLSINTIILFVAFFDGTVFMIAAYVKFGMGGFDKDPITGKEG